MRRLPLLLGGVVALSAALNYDPDAGLFRRLLAGLLTGLPVVLMLVLLLGLFFGALGEQIYVADQIEWSWSGVREGFLSKRFYGLFLTLTFGLLMALGTGLRSGLAAGMVTGLAFGLTVALFVGLLTGLGVKPLDLRPIPNEGLRRSAKNALVVTVVVSTVVSAIFRLLNTPSGLSTIGLFLGPACGLIYGGRTVIAHGFIRDILRRSGVAPLNYAEFLDYCASRHLLRKIGGGYVFRHRMLLEYFAEADW